MERSSDQGAPRHSKHRVLALLLILCVIWLLAEEVREVFRLVFRSLLGG